MIDDGSTDSTAEIILRYGHLITSIFQSNRGVSAARNIGIINAKYNLIAFLDSDDYWTTEHLAKLSMKKREYPDAALIYSGKYWVDEQGVLIQQMKTLEEYPEGWIFRNLLNFCAIQSTSVVLAERDVLLKYGGFNENSKFRNAQDLDLWLRISANEPIYAVKEATVFYRVHSESSTFNLESRAKGHLAALENALFLIKFNKINCMNRISIRDGIEMVTKVYEEFIVTFFHEKKSQ